MFPRLSFFLALTISLLALAPVTSAPSTDEITSLPGWTGPLPSRQYSGYLDITQDKHLHYWFVESENDPANDPVVMWLNGGPGCSSLDGFVYEHGPFRFDDNIPPNLVQFEYSWAKVANMIYLEAPVGVGFSYSDNPADYNVTDDTTANDNKLAVEKFFQLFPEFSEHEFFITGESYGGVYVPTLAEAIVQATLNGSYTGAPLKGIGVGNGCTGTEIGICANQETTYDAQYFVETTSFLTEELKAELTSACDWNTPMKVSPACSAAQDKMHKMLATGINLYDVYGDCIDGTEEHRLGQIHSKIRGPITEENKHIHLKGPDACINSISASAYFNQASVQAAIHVKKPAFKWWVCGTAPGWNYISTRPNLPRDTYPLLNQNIRVTIYNGDWDACVPYTDNGRWTANMGYKLAEEWHPWYYRNNTQLAGFAYRYSTNHDFTYITIRGGRHEVPESAPERAFEMITRITQKQNF